VIFEVAAVLVLRAHYTMDVSTGALAAVSVAQICGALSKRFARFRIQPAE
jgi:membrane-associated phospholipid phosphatase